MKRRIVRGLLGVLLSGVSALVMAEDIDLFVDNDVAAGDAPNVLLVLDNGANFSASAMVPEECAGIVTAMDDTVGGIEQCALYKVVESLKPGSVKLGVMVFSGGSVDIEGCESGNGGCLAYPITELTAESKPAMLSWVKSWVTSEGGTGGPGKDKEVTSTEEVVEGVNIKSNANKNGAVMQEAWALFAGKKGLSGRSYTDMKPETTCGSNYVIFVGNSFNNSGKPNEGGNASPAAALKGTLSDSAMNAWPVASDDQKALITGPIPVSCGSSESFTFSTNSTHENGGYYADEWARYMLSQGIKTYSIGVLGSGCQAEYEALLKSMGSKAVGGGKYFPTTNYAELKTALDAALSEIQSVNSVFASVSLPVSVNTQGTYLNQVFVGMFRPDGDAKPRWYGNLKQYKLGYDETKILRLLDADDAPAISSGDTGFISECARSYWTPMKNSSNDNLYWASIDEANCGGYSAQSETPDGNMVEKGGQGFKLRELTPSSRNVKTCGVSETSSCTATLANFNHDNSNISAADLGVVDGTAAEQAAERTALIKWARGENLEPEAIAGKTVDEQKAMMRPSSHGDVVHSRPVAINFADSDEDAPEVVVFYGGNDGMLRAVNGNREDGLDIGGKEPGEEIWSFVAPESYGLFARIKANSELISYPTVVGGAPKDYGFDGPVAAYKTASEAWIFASMRRGGRMLYAFDVSTPQTPSLKWRVGCNDDGCTSSDFSDIGQTWAVPIVLKSAGYVSGTTNKPMLIMGGGYDTCEDEDPASCGSSSKGRAIYLLDADTGGLLKKFTTDGGVVGDVTVIKDDEGLAQYAYAADLRGNVYRISGGANAPIGSVAPNLWVITKIAKLGGTGTDARKFMFGPDVVVESGVHYLMLGSGDREKPVASFTNATAVQNHFFMIKDQPLNAEWLSSESDNCDAAVFCMDSLYHIPAAEGTFVQSELDAAKGWYLQLDSSEKVVTSALTIFGTVYFSTHQPATAPDPDSEDMCSPSLGDSRSYSINFKNAEGLNGDRYADLVGDGLPPSPVAGLVTLDDGTTVPFCIGCSAESPLEGGEPPLPPSASQPKARVYWNVEQ